MPDIGDRIRLHASTATPVTGGGFLQAYAPTTGTRARRLRRRPPRRGREHASARAARCSSAPTPRSTTTAPAPRPAAATSPTPSPGPARPSTSRSTTRTCRSALHEGDGRTYLWFVNATREAQAGRLTVRGATTARAGTAHWAGGRRLLRRRRLHRPAARRAGGRDPGLTSPLGIDGEAPVAPRPAVAGERAVRSVIDLCDWPASEA